MKFDFKIDIQQLKAEKLSEVDAMAEEVRGLFITNGSGQSMVYSQKLLEAKIVSEFPNTTSKSEAPHIYSEATRSGISMLSQANIVLTQADKWLEISVMIEDRRLNAKDNITLASTARDVRMAANVNWQDIAELAK